jgi:FkbM family methyltransferase
LVVHIIYDIGFHTGRDSIFYLEKGFKVLGVEANELMVEKAKPLLKKYLKNNQCTIINKAIYEIGGINVDFYVNEEKDDWSSLFKIVAEKGVTKSKKITVPTITLKNLVDEFGVPYYIKCDIEDGDEIVSRQLCSLEITPTFVSFEITSVAILANLWAAGYRKFQLVNQAFNHLTFSPNPPLEGSYVPSFFDGYTSGLFGKELDSSRWLNIDEATSLFLDFIKLRDRYSNFCLGWIDVHATK